MKNFIDYLLISLFILVYLLVGMNVIVMFIGIVSCFSVISILGRLAGFDNE